jgi:hypothetical protein
MMNFGNLQLAGKPIIHPGTVAALGTAVLIGITAVGLPDLAFGLVSGLIIVSLVALLGELAVGRVLGLTGLVLNAITLPAAWSGVLAVRGTPLSLGDLALFAGFGLCVIALPSNLVRPTRFVVAVTALVVALGLLGTLQSGVDLQWQNELLRVLRLGSAATVGLAVASYSLKMLVTAASVVVWQAFFAVAASQIWGVQLTGRIAEVNSLASSTGALSSALRYQVPSSQVALVFAVFAVCTSLLGQRLSPATRVTTGVAFALTILNFSRNSVVVLLLASFFALLLFSLPGRFRRSAKGIGVILASAVLLLLLGRILPTGGLTEQLGEVESAFVDRVFVGFSAQSRNRDSSLLLRELETTAAVDAITTRPVAGFGFGVPYREPINYGEFWARSGRTYVHNGYLWVGVKSGLIGLAALCGLAGFAVQGALRDPRRFGTVAPLGAAALSTLLAMMIVMIWVPFLIDPWAGPTMALLGSIVFVQSKELTRNPKTQ